MARPDFAPEVDALASFLSESRLEIESTHRVCASEGCSYVCTGLIDGYCCRMCASSAGLHGPNCQKRHLRCSNPACAFLCTGVVELYCCRLCENDEGHGPLCKRLCGVGIGDGNSDGNSDGNGPEEGEIDEAGADEFGTVVDETYADEGHPVETSDGIGGDFEEGEEDDEVMLALLDEQIQANEQLLSAQERQVLMLKARIEALEAHQH